jgi:hypothetical protein
MKVMPSTCAPLKSQRLWPFLTLGPAPAGRSPIAIIEGVVRGRVLLAAAPGFEKPVQLAFH